MSATNAAGSGTAPAAASRQDPPSKDGKVPVADTADSCVLCAHAHLPSKERGATAQQAILLEVFPEVKAAAEATSVRELKEKLEDMLNEEKSEFSPSQRFRRGR